MIVPDVNLLIYAHGKDFPYHVVSRSWWERCLSGTEPIGLCSTTIFGFVRIATNRRLFRDFLPVEVAIGHVESWLEESIVQFLDFEAEDAAVTLRLLHRAGAGANLTTDAQLAALSIRYRAVIHSADSDYGHFPQVNWYNPLTHAGSR